MFKNTKGEVSASVIIGIILLIAVIVGLVIWSRSNKADAPLPEAYDMTTVPASTNASDNGAAAPSSVAPATDYQVQINNEVPAQPQTAPVLPQTGLGPNE